MWIDYQPTNGQRADIFTKPFREKEMWVQVLGLINMKPSKASSSTGPLLGQVALPCCPAVQLHESFGAMRLLKAKVCLLYTSDAADE